MMIFQSKKTKENKKLKEQLEDIVTHFTDIRDNLEVMEIELEYAKYQISNLEDEVETLENDKSYNESFIRELELEIFELQDNPLGFKSYHKQKCLEIFLEYIDNLNPWEFEKLLEHGKK